MFDITSQQARLARVLRAVQLPAETPVLLASDSNDVWRIGPVVLRVCWRGDRARFEREAAVTSALPPSVQYPPVLETGRDDELAWQVTSAIEGVSLAQVWPELSAAERRPLMHQVGQILAALNAHQFPAHVEAQLAAPRPVGPQTMSALIGADIVPLPTERALLMTGMARDLPHVDPALIDEVAACIRALAHIDPLTNASAATDSREAALQGCVHSDAHLSNVFWRDGRVVALLDFEWVRLGPPDLELEPYLRETSDTEPGDESDTRAILGWLAERNPAAFAHSELISRLWLYQLAHALRQLLIWPPDRAILDLPAHHPLKRLRRLVGGPHHLHRLIPDASR